MNLPVVLPGHDLVELMRRHPLGARDVALLEAHSLQERAQAEDAFRKHFDYGRPFPACLRLTPESLVFVGDADALIGQDEIAQLAAVSGNARFFLIENQVPAFSVEHQPPIVLQFDSTASLPDLVESSGVIRQKLLEFMVGEYFFFSADGAIAKYLAYDQLEPVVVVIADKSKTPSLMPWIRSVIEHAKSDWPDDHAELRAKVREGFEFAAAAGSGLQF